MSLSTLALLCSAKLISLFHIFFYFYCSSLPRLALVDTKIQSFVWHCICVTAAGLFSFCSISASWSKPDRDAASFTQTHTCTFFFFSLSGEILLCAQICFWNLQLTPEPCLCEEQQLSTLTKEHEWQQQIRLLYLLLEHRFLQQSLTSTTHFLHFLHAEILNPENSKF